MRKIKLDFDIDVGKVVDFDFRDFDLFGTHSTPKKKSSKKPKKNKETNTTSSGKTMFYEPPHHPSIAKIVTFESVEGAKKAAKKLFLLFKKAKSRDKKLILLRAVQLAANRARAGAKNPKFSLETRKKWLVISKIYEKVSEKMEKLYH